MKHTKDYDNVFKTLKVKHTRLFIPVINEIFGRGYSLDVQVENLSTEGYLMEKDPDGSGKIAERVSDLLIRICGDRYLLEFQTYHDNLITHRIAEYSFIAGNDLSDGKIGEVEILLPMAGLIFLRRAGEQTDRMVIAFRTPDGQSLRYICRNVVIGDYSKEQIIEKRLYPFIPFYIARYEGELSREEYDNFECVLSDLEYLRDEMEKLRARGELTGLELLDLRQFVNTVIIHITDGNSMEERLVKVMGGIVLETESERLVRVGREEGKKEGIKEGKKEGIKEGRELNLIALVCRKLKKNKTPEQIAEELEEDISLVRRICDIIKRLDMEYDESKIYAWMMNQNF